MPIKPSIPMAMQNRAPMHAGMPHVSSMTNFSNANPMIASGGHPAMMPYPQNYFGNQAIATPGFIANNFPSNSNTMTTEPAGRRKSFIENIHPFINEQNVLPVDLLNAFPVSLTTFFHFFPFLFVISFWINSHIILR